MAGLNDDQTGVTSRAELPPSPVTKPAHVDSPLASGTLLEGDRSRRDCHPRTVTGDKNATSGTRSGVWLDLEEERAKTRVLGGRDDDDYPMAELSGFVSVQGLAGRRRDHSPCATEDRGSLASSRAGTPRTSGGRDDLALEMAGATGGRDLSDRLGAVIHRLDDQMRSMSRRDRPTL